MITSPTSQKKSGFVAIIGRSNAGKSTLLNNLIGTKVAITTPKPQTTRHMTHGVLTEPRGQMVFIDTPGIFEKHHDQLTRQLNETAKEALHGVDVIVYLVDPTRAIGNEEHIVLRMLENATAPIILAINKTDLRDLPYLAQYEALTDRFAGVLQVSGLRARGLKPLIDKLFEMLPVGEPHYPEMQFTNVPQETWIAELIREKVFIQLHQEIPYSTTVEVRTIEDQADDSLRIAAVILTNAERYKGMIVGRGGQKIKEIGMAARKELSQIFNRNVHVHLEVETDEHWLDRLASKL